MFDIAHINNVMRNRMRSISRIVTNSRKLYIEIRNKNLQSSLFIASAFHRIGTNN